MWRHGVFGVGERGTARLFFWAISKNSARGPLLRPGRPEAPSPSASRWVATHGGRKGAPLHLICYKQQGAAARAAPRVGGWVADWRAVARPTKTKARIYSACAATHGTAHTLPARHLAPSRHLSRGCAAVSGASRSRALSAPAAASLRPERGRASYSMSSSSSSSTAAAAAWAAGPARRAPPLPCGGTLTPPCMAAASAASLSPP